MRGDISEDAFAWARRAVAEAGILYRISSGAALSAASEIARVPENHGKLIVAILALADERYFSTPLIPQE